MEEAAMRALAALELEQQEERSHLPGQALDDVHGATMDASKGREAGSRPLLRSQSSSLVRTAKLMQMESMLLKTANQDAPSKFNEAVPKLSLGAQPSPLASAPASVAGYEASFALSENDDSDRHSFITTGHISSRSMYSDVAPMQRLASLSSDGAHRAQDPIMGWPVRPPSLGRNSSGHTAPPSGPPSLVHSYYGPPSRNSMGPSSRSSMGPPSRSTSGGGTAPSRSASGGSSRSKPARNPSGGSNVFRASLGSLGPELTLEGVTESYEEGISPPNSSSSARPRHDPTLIVQALEEMASLEEPAAADYDLPVVSVLHNAPDGLPTMHEEEGEGMDADVQPPATAHVTTDTAEPAQQQAAGGETDADAHMEAEEEGEEPGAAGLREIEEDMEAEEGEEPGAAELQEIEEDMEAEEGEEPGFMPPAPVFVPESRTDAVSRLSRLSRATTADSPFPGMAPAGELHPEHPPSATSPISLVSSSDGQSHSESFSPTNLDDSVHPTAPSSSQSSMTNQAPGIAEEPALDNRTQNGPVLTLSGSFRFSRSNPWAPLPGPCLSSVTPVQAPLCKQLAPGTPFPSLATPQLPGDSIPV